jgi:hypothetical protein
MRTDRQALSSLWMFLLCASCYAGAATLFDIYGPEPYTPNIFVATFGWDHHSDGSSSGRSMAWAFTLPGNTAQLTSVTLEIGRQEERSPNLQIGIFADAGGYPALAPFFSLTPSPTGVTTVERQAHTFFFPPGVTVEPNRTYWLGFQPHSFSTTDELGDAYYLLSTSVLPPSQAAVRTFNSGRNAWDDWTVYPNTPFPVLRLEGTVVPEPHITVLLLCGGLGLLVGRHQVWRVKP